MGKKRAHLMTQEPWSTEGLTHVEGAVWREPAGKLWVWTASGWMPWTQEASAPRR